MYPETDSLHGNEMGHCDNFGDRQGHHPQQPFREDSGSDGAGWVALAPR